MYMGSLLAGMAIFLVHLDDCTAHLDSQKECIHWIQGHPKVPKTLMFFCLRRYPRYNLWVSRSYDGWNLSFKRFCLANPVGDGISKFHPLKSKGVMTGDEIKFASSSTSQVQLGSPHLTSSQFKSYISLNIYESDSKNPPNPRYLNVLLDRNRYFWHLLTDRSHFFPSIHYSLRWFRCYARLNQRRPQFHCSNVRRASQRLSLHWRGSVVQWWLGKKMGGTGPPPQRSLQADNYIGIFRLTKLMQFLDWNLHEPENSSYKRWIINFWRIGGFLLFLSCF